MARPLGRTRHGAGKLKAALVLEARPGSPDQCPPEGKRRASTALCFKLRRERKGPAEPGPSVRYWDDTPVVDFTGFDPGSCAMVLVREETSWPALTCVLVWDLLNVPPS